MIQDNTPRYTPDRVYLLSRRTGAPKTSANPENAEFELKVVQL